MAGGIVDIDVHGMGVEEAHAAVARKVQTVGGGVYRIRVIHGYHGGTRILNMLREEFSYGREPNVLRVEMGTNPGITELVLREY